MLDREPLLHPIAIDALRPTQMTVGLREVARKRGEWRARAEKSGLEYLGQHMIPVVIGPKNHRWLIDNHHLARALHDEGVEQVLVRVVADLSHLGGRQFETFMDNRNWLHPFNEKGHRKGVSKIPKHIEQLSDDPYRSLAGELRRAGGYAKDDTPFSEFLWADFLRRKVNLDLVERDFDDAVAKALKFARKPDAQYLPGWAGPHD
ncbi:ParB-like protein [Sphingomonas nostoxanthinifaciens]|uniref:ParB-like protein n=1 Tax=Sphingomonas nostoxanthinifaciens TaxID=2872652 RepID=UPI001CC1ECC1|nr:ParB-like protein [Sphingomonas nostoxanthinifaciens]UAK25719.1 chromosome partitioning protein ParB [Sphingomonas nostoxanthinifaciens]